MWYKLAILTLYLTAVEPEMTAPGIERTISEGVTSKGFKVMYGDEDMAVINEVVGEMEKNDDLKAKVKLNEAIKPLPVEDVKCLMSVDKYCSKNMRQVKGVLIEALKNDCVKCSIDDKESAGKVAAAMMAHDPVAWKLFLTRYDALGRVQRILGSALQTRPAKKPTKPEKTNLRHIGEPEIIESKYRYAAPGIKVRVKRYIAEKIP